MDFKKELKPGSTGSKSPSRFAVYILGCCPESDGDDRMVCKTWITTCHFLNGMLICCEWTIQKSNEAVVRDVVIVCNMEVIDKR